MLLLLIYTEFRFDAIVKSSSSEIVNINITLCYKDLVLKLLQLKQRSLFLILKMRICLNKNKHK